MKKLIAAFKKEVRKASTDPRFVHHEWFVKYHLEIVEKIISYIDIFDKKTNLSHAPIEVQIVSSADGASHLIAPFYAIHWKEHSQDTCEELMKENKRKALDDWNKKIVLPEVKKAFLSRYKQLLEYCGEFPEKYFP